MRSKVFTKAGVKIDELRKDLDLLRRLSSDKLDKLCRFRGQGNHLIQKDESMRSELAEFYRKTETPPDQYIRARRLGGFLVQACEEYDDDPGDVIADVDSEVTLGSELTRFFTGLSEAVHRAVAETRRERVARRFPSLTGVTYTCDVRADFPPFDVFAENVTQRSAKVQDWIPLAMIRFSSDEDAELLCQVDLPNLQRAIHMLQAAEHDLRTLQDELVQAGLLKAPE